MARILIIEDNPTNLDLMVYLLRAFGHTPLKALDGEEGLDMARRETPDLILCDIQIPKINGYEVARQLKAHPALRSIRLVAVTALAMVGDREKVLATGFDGYISKPIAPEDFVGQVERFLRADQRVPGSVVATQQAFPQAAVPQRKGTVLVVDNSPANLSLLQSLLEPFGYTVVRAATVDEALSLALAQSPDLIVSDVHMPGLDGFDLLQAIKRVPQLSSVPFIFLSSTVWNAAAHESKAKALGATKFIQRPIDPEKLLKEIEECL